VDLQEGPFKGLALSRGWIGGVGRKGIVTLGGSVWRKHFFKLAGLFGGRDQLKPNRTYLNFRPINMIPHGVVRPLKFWFSFGAIYQFRGGRRLWTAGAKNILNRKPDGEGGSSGWGAGGGLSQGLSFSTVIRLGSIGKTRTKTTDL